MYFYHGNKHYYLTRIFINDNDLRTALYLLNLTNEQFETLCYSLGSSLYPLLDDFVKNNDLSANEYYDTERKLKLADNSHISNLLDTIQDSIRQVTSEEHSWYLITEKPIYVGVMKSFLYGSIKHFFYENRELYLPQYDWYLINQNPKRKTIMETMFREYDKLSTISDALRYYQDPDDIPVEFLIRLQEIAGLTTNSYGNIFTSDQVRNLTKHLIEVWREKGSIYAIELFFACVGVDCTARELWFDRRYYYNPDAYNSFTKITSPNSFGYYLTPNDPQNVTFSFSDESVSYSDYTAPRPSRVWEYKIKTSTKSSEETITDLLGYTGNEEITYTFFKSNYLLLDFNYANGKNSVDKDTVDIFKELVNYMIPVYIRTMYTSDFSAESGEDDWDIFYSIDINGDDRNEDIKKIIDDENKERPVEMFKLFDTQNKAHVDADGQLVPDSQTSGVPIITDFYPADLVGTRNFISGTFSIIHDTRFETFITKNNDFDYKTAATSGLYDMIEGEILPFTVDKSYPLFYDNEGRNYYYNSYDEPDIILEMEDGTLGRLITESESDESELASATNITLYFFKVNNELTEYEIFPNLFVEDNNGSSIVFIQGDWSREDHRSDEQFNIDIEPQIDFTNRETFDSDYSSEPQNLFEVSSWKENVSAINDLYDENNNFVGDIQYDYYEYSNPIQNVEADLSSELTITLI